MRRMPFAGMGLSIARFDAPVLQEGGHVLASNRVTFTSEHVTQQSAPATGRSSCRSSIRHISARSASDTGRGWYYALERDRSSLGMAG